MKQSVMDFELTPFYYIKHPKNFFAEYTFRKMYIKERAQWGYCTLDAYNMNSWFLCVVPHMLRHIAQYTTAYPKEEFKELQDWRNFLISLAELFESCTEEKLIEQNEFDEAYIEKGLMQYREQFIKRREELEAERQKRLTEAFTLFNKHFKDLWY